MFSFHGSFILCERPSGVLWSIPSTNQVTRVFKVSTQTFIYMNINILILLGHETQEVTEPPKLLRQIDCQKIPFTFTCYQGCHTQFRYIGRTGITHGGTPRSTRSVTHRRDSRPPSLMIGEVKQITRQCPLRDLTPFTSMTIKRFPHSQVWMSGDLLLFFFF